MNALKLALIASSAAACLALMSVSPAFAATQIISLSTPSVGNQTNGDLPLNLGMDFTVNKSVAVESLGAFTNGDTGIFVSLYTAAGALLTSATVGSPPVGSDYAFSNLTSPLILAPGTYQIEATYNSVLNKDYNPFEPGGSNNVVFNTLGGSLTFLADYYSQTSTPGKATTLDTLSTGGYGAGTFLGSAVPEPATWLTLMAGFFGLGAILRSSRRKHVGAVATA